MAILMIRIFKQGDPDPDTTVKIPGGVLKVASSLIPKKVSQSLTSKGVDLEEILRLADNPEARGTLIEVEEHKKNEKIVISLE
jgi:hypothetical protein